MAEVAKDHTPEWQALGVAVLHRLLIENLLGGVDLPKPKYVHLVEEVAAGLRTGEFPLAALVMPATVERHSHDQFQRRADARQEHVLLSEAAQRIGHQSVGVREGKGLGIGDWGLEKRVFLASEGGTECGIRTNGASESLPGCLPASSAVNFD